MNTTNQTQWDKVPSVNPKPRKNTKMKTQQTDTYAIEHSSLPWRALDWMILCDKVNKYGNFYVAEVSPQFLDAADGPALDEAKQNLTFIVRAVNSHDELLASCKAAADALKRIQDDAGIGMDYDEIAEVAGEALEKLEDKESPSDADALEAIDQLEDAQDE